MTEKGKSKVNRVSFSLEPEYHDLIKEIAKLNRRNMTDELRLMVDKRAFELGMKPINPNSHASVRLPNRLMTA